MKAVGSSIFMFSVLSCDWVLFSSVPAGQLSKHFHLCVIDIVIVLGTAIVVGVVSLALHLQPLLSQLPHSQTQVNHITLAHKLWLDTNVPESRSCVVELLYQLHLETSSSQSEQDFLIPTQAFHSHFLTMIHEFYHRARSYNWAFSNNME